MIHIIANLILLALGFIMLVIVVFDFKYIQLLNAKVLNIVVLLLGCYLIYVSSKNFYFMI